MAATAALSSGLRFQNVSMKFLSSSRCRLGKLLSSTAGLPEGRRLEASFHSRGVRLSAGAASAAGPS